MIELLVKYLESTLGVTLDVSDWEGVERLPLFLANGYSYFRMQLFDLGFLLMVDRSAGDPAPSSIGKHIAQVRAKSGCEVVYVRGDVTAYARRKLIEAGIQFIVPGNQMYMPVLAIDLRERFPRRQTAVDRISPATQALVLYLVYGGGRAGQDRLTPARAATILGYTRMTMSRAFRELAAISGDSVINAASGPANPSAREVWEKLLPYMRDPVATRAWVPERDFPDGTGLQAGLTALAGYSMLAEPDRKVFAVSQAEWKAIRQNPGTTVMETPEAETVEIQVWSYPPALFASHSAAGAVDPLSLYLSIRNTRDERVEKALDDLLAGVKW